MPDTWLSPVHQHQDGEQDGDRRPLDGIGDQFPLRGDQRRHDAVELGVLQGEPQVGGEGIHHLKADEPGQDQRLIEARVQLAWEHHSTYRFIKPGCAQPNETRPLPARDGREPLTILRQVVRIVTDSTADLNEDQQKASGITVVPLNVRFGDEVFKDHVDLTGDDFFAKLKTSSQLPKTSQPPVGEFEEVFRRHRAAGDEVVAVLISSKVSGTYGAAEMAAKSVDAEHIEVIDSLTASMALGFLALEGAKLAKTGAGRAAVADRIRSLVPKARVLAAIDTLTYLERGGRIGRARALLGSLLNFKPLITLQDGEVAPLGRARGRVQAIDRLVDLLSRDGRLSNLAVLHGASLADAKRLRERVAGSYPGLDIPLTETGAVIGTYTGPGVIGFTYLIA